MPHRPSLVVGIGMGVAGVVILGALGGLVLVRGSGGEERPGPGGSEPRSEVASTTTEPRSGRDTEPGTAEPTTGAAGEESVLGPRVTLVAMDDDDSDLFLPVPPVVDELEPDTVLQVSVVGFGSFSTARARQCVTTTTRICGNPLAVQFAENGTARFQYLVTTSFAPAAASDGCRVRGARCSIVVEEVDGAHRAETTTVFHDEAPPPGQLRVNPRSGLVDGEEVVVEVTGLPPGAVVTAVVCAEPDADREVSCQPLGSGPMTVRSNGRAAAAVPVVTQDLGPQRLDCDRDRACAITVVADSALVRVPAVRIGLAVPPGSDFDAGRVAVGLGLSLALLAIAAYLMLRSDWSPIGEEAAPEIDEAEYADLDAIVAALPPDPEFDDLVASSRRR